MTTNLMDKTVIEPSLNDVLDLLKRDIFSTLNCMKVGKVLSFDMAKKTVSVQLLFKRLLRDGTSLSHPQLIDCPVITLQGGGGFVQFPIAPGDHCIVFFSDRNIDAWFAKGAEAVPYDTRAHDLSDAVALVGVNSLVSTMPAYLATQITMYYGGSLITLSDDDITLNRGTSNILMTDTEILATQGASSVDMKATEITATQGTSVVDMLPNQITITQGPSVITMTPASIVLSSGGSVITLGGGAVTIVHGGGTINLQDGAFALTDSGGAQLQLNSGFLKIGNAATTLLTLLDGLIDVIKAATVQDGSSTLPLTATTVAALQAYKAQLAVLLQ